jgi:hypothetical protein
MSVLGIPKRDLVKGVYYRLEGRHMKSGVWNGLKHFIGLIPAREIVAVDSRGLRERPFADSDRKALGFETHISEFAHGSARPIMEIGPCPITEITNSNKELALWLGLQEK